VNAELKPVQVTNADDLFRRLGAAGRPAILLSASVPFIRDSFPNAAEKKRNRDYVQSAHPQRIRQAVTELTKTALMRHAQLIFGAHPAISPMVLEAARNAGAPPESILIFQSDFFAGRIPGSTLALSNWSAGRLFLTPKQSAKEEREARNRSLDVMRRLMVSPKNLRGAIFVGGMEGVEEEAEIFKKQHPKLPRYAIASTGSAAQILFDRSPGDFAGKLSEPDVLKTGRSYALLARQILDNMQIPDPTGREGG
jgi:hypothetical protein